MKAEPTGSSDRFDVGCAEIEESRAIPDIEPEQPEDGVAMNEVAKKVGRVDLRGKDQKFIA